MTKFSSKRPLTDEEEAEIQQMIASDPDNPEATDEQIAQAKPFREAFPELFATFSRAEASARKADLEVRVKRWKVKRVKRNADTGQFIGSDPQASPSEQRTTKYRA